MVTLDLQLQRAYNHDSYQGSVGCRSTPFTLSDLWKNSLCSTRNRAGNLARPEKSVLWAKAHEEAESEQESAVRNDEGGVDVLEPHLDVELQRLQLTQTMC